MIDANVLKAAQSVHGVTYSDAELAAAAPAVAADLEAVRRIRALKLPFGLQPGIGFDPRMPGHHYPDQGKSVRLHPQASRPAPSGALDIAFASVAELSDWIRTGTLTSRRVTEVYLERIARIDDRLHSFVTVLADSALREADERDAELERGVRRGPLHGIPYGLKDVFDTAGTATTWGATLFKDRVPTQDAAIVRMLRESGAVLLGKVAPAELCAGTTWYGGMVRNPWNTEEPAGGSSSGSGSSVAAGLCAFAIGTESLSSIINPADRCGVVGLRPTFGRVPVEGGMPLTPSLERIGPICRQVEDAALVLAAINGPDATSATSIDFGFSYDSEVDFSALRVGYSPKWFERSSFGQDTGVFQMSGGAPVAEGCKRGLALLKELGATLVEIELPDLPYDSLMSILYVEASAVFEELMLQGMDKQLKGLWPPIWREFRFLSAIDYYQAERFRRLVMNEFHKIFNGVDLLIAPTYGSFHLSLATNFTGHPALTFRAGFTEIGSRTLSLVAADPNGPTRRVTANLCLYARLFEEGKLVSVGRALEEKLDVWRARPPID